MLATISCLCDACVGNLVFMSRALNMHHYPHDPISRLLLPSLECVNVSDAVSSKGIVPIGTPTVMACDASDRLQIPRVEARLSTFLTRFEAQQQLAEAKGILEGHQKAHQELKGSPCMAAALQLTLAMGNFLNWGTRLGQGAGFRLRNLPKLQVGTGCFFFSPFVIIADCSWKHTVTSIIRFMEHTA